MEGQLEAILRLFLALVAGGILGYERSAKRIDAGFRTHIIVCMASCAIMLTNIYMFLQYQTGDPTRMPAQVISGVGFLGAGCILVTRERRIKGVTTAAGLWGAACLGLCIGAGNYIVAGTALVMVYITMTVLRGVDERLLKKTKYMRIYLEFESTSSVTGFLKHIRGMGMKVLDVETMETKLSNNIAVFADLRLTKADSVENVIADLEQVEGIVYASEI